ncbi:MAG TPA: hypothetical protein PL110_15565 [Candidatus Eremiobacteraeota bacterium]|nr:MAG: hypothetical protein BWY64_01685 [bacterium ADurb.Bin363]HPZ09522.1 hypothetical protein [Candidatus Eremiobacteraeota bacterium]
MKAYRPCKFRKSKLGIFQCEKHCFDHSHPDHYEGLYSFCLNIIPENFCSYVDFGFNMEDEPTVFINCTHPFISRPMKDFEECKTCEYAPQPEDMQALGG